MTIWKTLLITAALSGFALPIQAAQADCNADKVFKKCQACHMIGENAQPRVGPPLNGIVGSEIASFEGFRYSDAFKALKAEGFVWTEEELQSFLEKPRKAIKGTRMSFAGLRKEEDRSCIIEMLSETE